MLSRPSIAIPKRNKSSLNDYDNFYSESPIWWPNVGDELQQVASPSVDNITSDKTPLKPKESELPFPFFDDEEELNKVRESFRPPVYPPKEKPKLSNLVIARRLARQGEQMPVLGDLQDVIINSEDTPLVIEEALKPGWWEWTRTKVTNAATYTYDKAKSTALYVKDNPGKTLLAAVSATTFSISAFNNALKSTWGKANALQRLHAIANFLSSFSINTIMNTFMLTTVWQRFLNMLKHTFDSPREFITTALALTVGLGGTVALSMVTLNVYQWLPAAFITAWIPVLINIVPTALLPRTLGALNILIAISNSFRSDARAQAQFADALPRINEAYLEKINKRLDKAIDELLQDRNITDPLSKDEIQEIAADLAEILTDFAKLHPDLIKDKTGCEYVSQYANMLFDITLGCLFGLTSSLTYMQKGVDGFSLIGKWAGSDLSVLSPWIKRGIGTIPGLATGMLYGSYGTKIRETTSELVVQLYNNPKEIPRALCLLLANSLAAFGPKEVAKKVIERADNISFFHDSVEGGEAFTVFNYGGGFATNGVPAIDRWCLPNKDPVHISISEIHTQLEKVNTNLVPESIAKKFKVFNDQTNKNPESEDSRVARYRSSFVV